MLRYFNKGYTIEINIPEEYGYKGYSVVCTYRYVKQERKYLLSMWLRRKDIGDKFKIESQEIDTQFIESEKEDINENICKIVEQAASTEFFNKCIESYEYTYKCFDKGDETFESERLADIHA